MKTRQQVFNEAYLGLAAQGWRRAYRSGRCKYRVFGAEGEVLKCAIGQCIPDDKYDPNMETSGIIGQIFWKEGGNPYIIQSERQNRLRLVARINKRDLVFARKMQEAHDGASNKSLKARMDKIAVDWKLTIPELSEVAST